MVDFGKNKPEPGSKLGSDPRASVGRDVATAEYSCFYIHQIKAWSSWAIDLAEISYTVDLPCYLNVERSADV
jgi:hypothetical protein